MLSSYDSLQSGDIELAKQRVEQVLVKQPQAVDALILKGEIALLECEPEKALALARKVQSSNTNADAELLAGQALLMLHRISQARRAFSSAIEMDPGLTAAYSGLGWACLMRDDLNESEVAFNKVLELEPQDPDAHGGLAVLRFAEQNVAGAKVHADAALTLDPQNVIASAVMATISQHEGNPAVARALSRQIVETNVLTPFGFTGKDIAQRFQQAPAGRRVIAKIERKVRRDSRKSKLH